MSDDSILVETVSFFETITQFKSLAGATILAVFYFVWFSKISQEFFRNPSRVFMMVALFCAIRIPSFAMRAIIAERLGREEVPDFALFIAYQVLFGAGIIVLLYTAYTIVLDRQLLTSIGPSTSLFNRFTGNRIVFGVIAIPAVVLGIVGPCLATISNPNESSTLHQASTVIFLVLAVLVAYRIALTARAEISSGYQYADKSPVGRCGAYFLCVVAILFLLRGCFEVATMRNLEKQNNERLWYPLFALPEVLVVCFLLKLAPPRYELPTQTNT